TGDAHEAIELYRKIIDKTQNPQSVSAMAALLQPSAPQTADALYKRADELFEKHYDLHPDAVRGHFVEHLLRREADDPRLLNYATRDHMLRPNAETKFLLMQVFWK